MDVLIDFKLKGKTDLPFVAHFFYQDGHIIHCILSALIVEHGVETELILERITGQRTTQFLMIWEENSYYLSLVLTLLNPSYLNRSEMDEIVAGFLGHSETILPLTKRSQTFGQDRLAVNTIDWQDFVIVTVS